MNAVSVRCNGSLLPALCRTAARRYIRGTDLVVLPNCLCVVVLLRGSSDAMPGALRQPLYKFYRCDAARIGSIYYGAQFEPVLNELSLLTLVVGWRDFPDCCYR